MTEPQNSPGVEQPPGTDVLGIWALWALAILVSREPALGIPAFAASCEARRTRGDISRRDGIHGALHVFVYPAVKR